MSIAPIAFSNECIGCFSCVYSCPVGALEEGTDNEGFYKPIINEDKCVECGKCSTACPISCKIDRGHYDHPDLYVFTNENPSSDMSATVGGVKIVAEKCIQNNAEVVGAVWDENYECVLEFASEKESLKRIYKSKYVQSRTSDIYLKVEKKLKQGITIIFTGLPCQVEGLYSFLGKDYDNLYTIDLLCNNVPSPKVFRKFIDEITNNEKVLELDFRYKGTEEIGNYALRVRTEKEDRIFVSSKDALYYRAFIDRKMAGKQCENCSFGKFPRPGDISLGDIFGAEVIDKKYVPGKTESMLINSEKGIKLANLIFESATDYRQVPIQILKDMHPHLVREWPLHPDRDRFYKMLDQFSFFKTCKALNDNFYDVAIVGLPTNPNYGGALTYLALKWILDDLNKTSLMILPPGDDYIWLPKRITNFRNNPYSSGEIVCMPDKFNMWELSNCSNVFMIGSDQLFSTHFVNNGIYSDCDEFASLDWVSNDKKKVAYAASFGDIKVDCPNDMKERMRYFIRKFDEFSVREESAVKLCKETFDMPVTWVLDPIFLCGNEKFIRLTEGAETSDTELFSYLLDETEDTGRIEKSISNETSLRLSKIGDSALKQVACIEDWLASVIKAKFIITDSFHCTCFAVMFNIPFVTFVNKTRGTTRFELFRFLGLEDRLITGWDNYLEKKDRLLAKDIDWGSVNKKLDELRKKSKEVLRRQLEPQSKHYDDYDVLHEQIVTIKKQLDEKIQSIDTKMQRIHIIASGLKRTWESLLDSLPSDDCIVFGTGKYGEKCVNEMAKRGFKIKYFVDNDPQKQGMVFHDRPIYSPDMLLNEKNVTIIISSNDYHDEMRKQLTDLGVCKSNRVIDYICMSDMVSE